MDLYDNIAATTPVDPSLRRCSMPLCIMRGNHPVLHRVIACSVTAPRLCVSYENIETAATKFAVCSRCRQTAYCSADCQRQHWKREHKTQCGIAPAPAAIGAAPTPATTVAAPTSETKVESAPTETVTDAPVAATASTNDSSNNDDGEDVSEAAATTTPSASEEERKEINLSINRVVAKESIVVQPCIVSCTVLCCIDHHLSTPRLYIIVSF
jgi:hypothetical protein